MVVSSTAHISRAKPTCPLHTLHTRPPMHHRLKRLNRYHADPCRLPIAPHIDPQPYTRLTNPLPRPCIELIKASSYTCLLQTPAQTCQRIEIKQESPWKANSTTCWLNPCGGPHQTLIGPNKALYATSWKKPKHIQTTRVPSQSPGTAQITHKAARTYKYPLTETAARTEILCTQEACVSHLEAKKR